MTMKERGKRKRKRERERRKVVMGDCFGDLQYQLAKEVQEQRKRVDGRRCCHFVHFFCLLLGNFVSRFACTRVCLSPARVSH